MSITGRLDRELHRERFKRNRSAERKKKEKMLTSPSHGATARQDSRVIFVCLGNTDVALYPSLSSTVIEQLTILFNVMAANEESADMRLRLYEMWSRSHPFLQQGALPQDIGNWTAERELSALCVNSNARNMRAGASVITRQMDVDDYPETKDYYAYSLPTPSDTALSEPRWMTPTSTYPTPCSRSASLAPNSEFALFPPTSTPPSLPFVSVTSPPHRQPQSVIPLGIRILQAVKREMDEESALDRGNPKTYAEFADLWTPLEEKMTAILHQLH
ncbi:hypothetical protein B0H14DRAFT_2570147 [Mycena olivaceomarginata]|nr:hypothetical protein B0H14DRAFT_2570147 [Mycena olivaceomarginata]